MSKYTIKASYQTGNSFSNEDTEDLLGYVVEDKEVARKALVSLKKHYEAYQEQESFSFRRKSVEINNSKEPWYYKGDWSDSWQHSVILPLDDGSTVVVSVPYVGYFETLYGLDIVLVDEEDDPDSVRF